MSTDKLSDQQPSTTAVPSDDNEHKVTLILIFMQSLKSYYNCKQYLKELIIDKLHNKEIKRKIYKLIL